MPSTPESRLAALGLSLPPAPEPGGVYQPIVEYQGLLYVSGHVPVRLDGSVITGTVGADMDLQEARLAAQQAGLTLLASLKAYLGELNRIDRLLKSLGMVNCSPTFTQQPQVINGYSELMMALWGPDRGVGARSAVGMMLPLGAAVEVEAVFALQST
ncbi:MAG: RidA family protein [Bacteroidota bacterium]